MSAIRFLVADSSPALQTFVRRELEKFGFSAADIKTAGDPAAALEIAAELKPDFLLSDWFPKESMNGIELYHKVREFNDGCRFALMSIDVEEDRKRMADEAGALFLLKKPCTAEELRNMLATTRERLLAKSRLETRDARIAAISASVQPIKVGDMVRYQGRTDAVKLIILRRGELVVQLEGQSGMVPASRIEKIQ